MRLVHSSVLALTAVLLSGTSSVGVSSRSTERDGESRNSGGFVRSVSLADLAVNTRIRTTRIPSLMSAEMGAELPDWLLAAANENTDFRTPAPIAGTPDLDWTSLQGGLQEAAWPEPREFFFTRVAYNGFGRRGFFGGGGGGSRWATDYPKADLQFLVVLKRLVNIDAYDLENAVRLDDPAIRLYPFLYALEVGSMALSQPEITGLRAHLESGGFLMIDDFWGTRQWAQFEYQMSQLLPGRPIQDIPADHPIFNTVYKIDEVLQVPALGRGIYGRPTYEQDGYVPTVSGIFDDSGRLMVIINWNTDLGDAWEHAENPYYPVEFSTYAFQVGVNTIIYGMSH